MNKFSSNYFGEIDLGNIEEYYEAELSLENQVIDLDLNFYKKETVGIDQLIKVDQFLNDLKKYEEEIRRFIDRDFEDGGISLKYLESYTDAFEEDELETLIDEESEEKTAEQQLISKLYIRRIGVYPNDNHFAIFDFHVNHKVSDQILVIIVENDMNYYITWES